MLNPSIKSTDTDTAFKIQSPLELKIKAKSLASEARIIRALELRLKRRQTKGGKLRPGLRDPRALMAFGNIEHHRKHEVRFEARDTNVARGFLKGHDYIQVERFAWTQPTWAAVEAMVKKYAQGDSRIIAQRYAEWLQSAKDHFKGINYPKVEKDHAAKNAARKAAYKARGHKDAKA